LDRWDEKGYLFRLEKELSSQIWKTQKGRGMKFKARWSPLEKKFISTFLVPTTKSNEDIYIYILDGYIEKPTVVTQKVTISVLNLLG
jgi:hypothetical protein